MIILDLKKYHLCFIYYWFYIFFPIKPFWFPFILVLCSLSLSSVSLVYFMCWTCHNLVGWHYVLLIITTGTAGSHGYLLISGWHLLIIGVNGQTSGEIWSMVFIDPKLNRFYHNVALILKNLRLRWFILGIFCLIL